MVGAREIDRGRGRPVVIQIDVEIIVTHASEEFQLPEEGDLVLHIAGGDGRRDVVVSISTVRGEARGDGEGVTGGHGRARGCAEEASVALAGAVLVAEFEPGEHPVPYGAGVELRRQVGLIKVVVAIVSVVICGQRQIPGVIDGTAGIHILVILVVVGEPKRVGQLHAAEVVVEHRRDRIEGRPGRTLVAVAEEAAPRGVERLPISRGDPPVGGPRIIQVLVVQRE